MIRFAHVEKRFGQSNALTDINFHLPAGTFNFVTGHSGAGKSTLLRLIAGLDKPTAGEIEVSKHRLTKLKNRDLTALRRQMGIVFQDNQLLDDRTVFDNVALPLIISGRNKADILSRVGAALQRVALTHKAMELPSSLSGGEQQRIGIARAVVNQPKLLIADEPTGNLDPDMSQGIIRLFQRFNAAGVTVLIATHDMSLLKLRHHKRLVLRSGRLQDAQTSRPRPANQRASSASEIVHA